MKQAWLIGVTLLGASVLPLMAQSAQQQPPPRPTTVLPGSPVVITGQLPAPRSKHQGEKPPKPLARPSGRFQSLLLQYRHGNPDAAIETLATWDEGDVIAEAVPNPDDDVWSRAALALFLTETGLRKGTFGQFSEYSPRSILLTDWGVDNVFEIYSYRSYSLMKALTRNATDGDGRLLSFIGRWYDYTLSWMTRHPSYAFAGLSAMANHDLSDQPDVALFLGSVSESDMGPWMIGCGGGTTTGPDGCVPNPNQIPYTPTQEALYLLRHVLAVAADTAEAHLRLGHVLHTYNRTREARPHLERALTLAQQQHLSYLVYLAHMQIGDVAEHEGRLPAAIEHFRAALALAPATHIVRVALGDALLRAGDASGWAEARTMFDGENERAPGPSDPWFFYRSAQYWRVASGFLELRELVRLR